MTSAKEAAVNAMAAVQADATEVKNADSLKAAVEAKYIKIILAADIDNAYIEVNYDLTLDLNGHTLTLADRTYAVVKVNGGAHFTLCDGSAAKSGKIKSDYAGIIAIGSDADKAVVEINGGTIEGRQLRLLEQRRKQCGLRRLRRQCGSRKCGAAKS